MNFLEEESDLAAAAAAALKGSQSVFISFWSSTLNPHVIQGSTVFEGLLVAGE